MNEVPECMAMEFLLTDWFPKRNRYYYQNGVDQWGGCQAQARIRGAPSCLECTCKQDNLSHGKTLFHG